MSGEVQYLSLPPLYQYLHRQLRYLFLHFGPKERLLNPCCSLLHHLNLSEQEKIDPDKYLAA